MGRVLSSVAVKTESALADTCRASSGSTNVLQLSPLVRYLFEDSGREQRDLGFSGELFAFVSRDRCRKIGSWRIDGGTGQLTMRAGHKVYAPAVAELRRALGAR